MSNISDTTHKAIVDTVEVVSANAGAIYIATLEINTIIKVVAGLTALGYTAWKWVTDIKDRNRRLEKERNDKA